MHLPGSLNSIGHPQGATWSTTATTSFSAAVKNLTTFPMTTQATPTTIAR